MADCDYVYVAGRNAAKLKNDLYSAIADVYLQQERHLVSSARNYKSKHNFFELVRFDFVLDDDLNVYLMEVNMSPNLSSAHFVRNSALYEHVVYGLLSVTSVLRDTSSSIDDRCVDWCCTKNMVFMV